MKNCLLAATVTALVTAGCGGGPGPTTAPTGGGEPAFQRVLDRIGPDGQIDKTTALQAFAVAFGRLPGVPRPHGPAMRLGSGTGPLRWVMALLGQVTPAQRAAVLAVVPKPAGATAAADGG